MMTRPLLAAAALPFLLAASAHAAQDTQDAQEQDRAADVPAIVIDPAPHAAAADRTLAAQTVSADPFDLRRRRALTQDRRARFDEAAQGAFAAPAPPPFTMTPNEALSVRVLGAKAQLTYRFGS